MTEDEKSQSTDDNTTQMDIISITQVSPIAAGILGGLTITINGSGFQEGAAIYFGSNIAKDTTYESANIFKVVVPHAKETGSVPLTVVNPDGGQFTLDGGFTYITSEIGDIAQVFGVSPLIITEDADTEVTLRGRNLIDSYKDGLVALRSPSRVNLKISSVDQIEADESGIESLTFKVTVTATPQLEPLERIAIQVLASKRSRAKDDLMVESSKQMFTVIPKDIPVPIAFTPSLSSEKSTMVIVLGENLEGCVLQFDDDTQTHIQTNNNDSLMAMVSLAKTIAENAKSTAVSIIDKNGNAIGTYGLLIAPSADLKKSDTIPIVDDLLLVSEGVSQKSFDTPPTDFTLDLIPIPEQKFIGPTAKDSLIFDLRGELNNNLVASAFNFEIQIFSVTIILPIINRVVMLPLFDGGGSVFDSPILAKVGELFPVRGAGILVAARIEIIITVTVYVIIGIRFDLPGYGFFNEFPGQFPNAIGIVVIGFIVQIEITIIISFLSALVLPDGRLRLIFVFNLTIGIDFTISSNGQRLSFIPNFTHSVRFSSILPFNDPLPCGGRFQLADDNGQTSFLDSFGGHQSYYFARSAGECCVSWRFNLELVRFTSNGDEQPVQPPFDVSLCLNALESQNLVDVVITSVPPPIGTPQTLVMNIADTAILKALAVPVDQNGNPTGPGQDITELGYGVEFYLDQPLEVLSQGQLPDGFAVAIQDGSNVIRAAVTSVRVLDDEQFLSFWQGSILGFDIIRFLAEGQPPRLRTGGLPVTVNPNAGAIKITPTLAYRDENNANQLVATTEMIRAEPFETSPRQYLLAVKMTVPKSVSYPQTIKFKVNRVQMRVQSPGSSPVDKPPLDITDANFGRNRKTAKAPALFFTGTLSEVNQEFSITINSRPNPTDLIEVSGFSVVPNNKEVGPNSGNLTKLVPPGKLVGNKDVLLNIALSASSNGASVSLMNGELKLKVQNEETFEEYLRVFEEQQRVMNESGVAGKDLREFAMKFYDDLKTQGATDALLKSSGARLWRFGYEYVQGTTDAKDDRLLYYARLQSIAALRAYHHRQTPPQTLNQITINKFEWESRGLETSLGINPDEIFATIHFDPTTSRKAIVTGYDPFGLPGEPDKSNPSGLIALQLNKKTGFGTPEIPFGTASAPVTIRTVIFPVRYSDFNEGLIEKVMSSSIASKVIIMTCSQTGRDFYDVDRFASRRRLVGAYDNNLKKLSSNIPPVINISESTNESFESNLPYEFAITEETQRKLPGPNVDTPFVMNQSYRVLGYSSSIEAIGLFRDDPNFGDEDAYTKQLNDFPPVNTPLEVGSGGSYLSNEIFYRTARVRSNLRPSVTSGHLHIPSVGNTPKTKANRLIDGVSQILKSFLQYLFPLQSSGDLSFPTTVVNTISSPKLMTITNPLDRDLLIEIASVVISPVQPFTVQLPRPLPIIMSAGSNETLSFTFAPTMIGNFSSTITLKDSNNIALLIANLKGKCVPFIPRITIFSPNRGQEGALITIRGEHFDGATNVRIGSSSIPFTFVDSTKITATITDDVNSDFVYVETPNGIAVSSTRFTLVLRPPRD